MRPVLTSLLVAAVLAPLPAFATTYDYYTGSTLPLYITGPGGYSLSPALNTPTDAGWKASIPGATWVNASGQDGYGSGNPNGAYDYNVEFTLIGTFTFTGQFASDNNATLYITPLATGVPDALGSNVYGTSNADYSYNTVTSVGPLVLAAGNYYFDFDLTNGTGLSSGNDNSTLNGPTGVLAAFEFTSVNATPEPSSLVLLGSGIVGLAGAARRRMSK